MQKMSNGFSQIRINTLFSRKDTQGEGQNDSTYVLSGGMEHGV